jgi:hypothetical protein
MSSIGEIAEAVMTCAVVVASGLADLEIDQASPLAASSSIVVTAYLSFRLTCPASSMSDSPL